MYKHFQTKGLLATPEHLAETKQILGREPRSLDTFAAEVTTAWKNEATAGVKATTS